VKLVVTGGRAYTDRRRVFEVLDLAHARKPITLLIHGACCDKKSKLLTGADCWAEEWAIAREVPYIGVPARWASESNAAGPLRNQRMLKDWVPDGCVAFPGGSGTNGMVELAKAAGVVVWDLR